MDKNKLIKKIEDCREIMIYGAGNLGRMAYEIIHFLQMESKVTGFIETQKTKESYLELPIISLEQLDAQQKDRVILVAVREKLYETIEALLREHGVEEYYDFRCLYNPNWAGVKQVSEKWKKKCKTYLETERGVQECQQ